MKKIRNFDLQEKKLLHCITQEPGKPDHYVQLGKLYFLNSEYDKAAAAYNRGLGVDPENIHLLFNLGVTKEALGESKSAKEIYRKVLELDCNYKPAQTRLEKLTSF